jgi:hypothetical protein
LAPTVYPDFRNWCAEPTNRCTASSSPLDLSQGDGPEELATQCSPNQVSRILDLAQYTATAAPMDWLQREVVGDEAVD